MIDKFGQAARVAYCRDDAWYCMAHFHSIAIDVEGIAVPLYPRPDYYLVYISCDWLPAYFWRKPVLHIDVINDNWHTVKAHISKLTLMDQTQFYSNKHGYYGHGTHDQIHMRSHREVPLHYGRMFDPTDPTYLVRTIRSWLLAGWYVKDCATPKVLDTSTDELRPLFNYRDCVPVESEQGLTRRMKQLIPFWRAHFEIAGMNFKQKYSNATPDDIEMAASEYCEGFIYRDWLNQRIQPTQKATALLYALFCGAAGVLV
jgi:hypothetical protein